MDNNICVVCNIEKSIDNYYNKYRECKPCTIKEVENDTMKRKIKYQINIKYIMKKIEMFYLQSLKYINKKETMKEKYINNKYKNLIRSYKI